MSRRGDLLFLLTFAAGLMGCGVWFLGRSGLDLPLRDGRGVIHLVGATQVLFALGPLAWGAALALAGWRVHRGGRLAPDQVTRLETAVFLVGVIALIAGILLGERR